MEWRLRNQSLSPSEEPAADGSGGRRSTAAGPTDRNGRFLLGDWEVDPDTGVVRHDGKQRHLGPQQMDLVVYLAANRDRVVPKEEIFEAIWGDAAVEDVGLPRCISEIRKILGDDAREPRYIRTIPKRGYCLIAEVRAPELEPPPPASRRRSTAGAVVVLAGLAAGAAALLLLRADLPFRAAGEDRSDRLSAVERPVPVAAERPAVAVLGFSNLTQSPEVDWLATALAEMLANELALAPDLRVIPNETVAHVRQISPSFLQGTPQELAPDGLGNGAPETLRRMRVTLGVDFVVLGTYLCQRNAREDVIRLDLRVQDAVTGETVTALIETGRAERFLDLVSLAGIRLREALGVEPEAGLTPPAALLSRHPAAVRLYSDGLRRLRRFEADAARELLERSLAAAPDQPLAHLALSEAWTALGYDGKAVEAAARASELAAGLPREQRLWIEARYHAVAARWDKAIEVYQALWIFAPQNLEYGLSLARTQNRAGKPTDALATLEAVRARAGSDHRDPRLDLVASAAAQRLGDHPQALAAAGRVVEAARALGAELLVARGRHQQATALYVLGRVREAMTALDEAKTAYAAVGDRRSEAETQVTLADWLDNDGDLARGQEILETALAVFQGIGDRAGEAKVLARLAYLGIGTGDLAAAEARSRQALAIHRQVGDLAGEADALNALAISMANRRRYQEAEPLFEQMLAIHRDMGNQESVAVTLTNLGRLRLLQLQLDGARASFLEAEQKVEALGLERRLALVRFNLGYVDALAGDLDAARIALSGAATLYRRLDNRRMLGLSLDLLGGVLVALGDFTNARAHLEKALSQRISMGDPARIAFSRSTLTDLLLEEGKVDAAERMARQALTAARSADDYVVMALLGLARTLLVRERLPEARRVIGEAEDTYDWNAQLDDDGIRLLIMGGRIRAANGEKQAARELLAEALERTAALGLRLLHAEARLALGEIELRSGDTAASARLKALEAEARARGWVLMARKARAVAAGEPRAITPRPGPPAPSGSGPRS